MVKTLKSTGNLYDLSNMILTKTETFKAKINSKT